MLLLLLIDLTPKIHVNGRNDLYHRPELDQIQLMKDRLRNDDLGWQNFMKEQQKRVRAVKDVRMAVNTVDGSD